MDRFQVQVTAEDDWASIAELLDTPGMVAWLIEGFIGATANDARLLFRNLRPPDGDDGLPLAAGAAAGVGPVGNVEAGYPMQEIWIKNAAAGSDATVTVTGVVA